MYMSALSCSFPPLNFPPIKTFEIMASGTTLLTTPFLHHEKLFGNKKCFFTYNPDCSDVAKVAKYVQQNKDEAKTVATTALTIVRNNHLFEHRAEELFLILSSLLVGNTIPKKWGI